VTDTVRPQILFIVDIPRWAHDRKTQCLQRMLDDEFDIVLRYAPEVCEPDIERADLVLVYYWLQFRELAHVEPALIRNRHKLLIGICSHAELEGPAVRDQGLRIINDLARAVFVNNRLLLQEFERECRCEVFYTPNGVDTHFFQPQPRVERDRMLRVGWAGSLANHPAALRGFHEVIVPAVQAVDGLELRTAIREERWRTADEMRDFYQALDVYVCASVCEGTPNTCLEAAASGVPVVTTRVGNMPELVVDGENGFFIERDAHDLAAKLRQLRDDRVLCLRMSEAIRRAALAWDWTVRVEPYRQMFQRLVAQVAS
jgi:glycosyltransferase involved in cell wall biosynthesis